MLYRPMKNTKVKIGGFVVLFIYGVIVHALFFDKTENWGISILSNINRTISVFFPSRGDYESLSGDRCLLFHTNFLFLLTSIYASLLIASWFGRKMMNHAQFYLSRKEKWVLFFGSCEQSILLAKDITKQKPETGCVFIVPEKAKDNKEIFDQLDEFGAVVLYADFERETTNYISTRIFKKVTRYFLLGDNQDFNIKTALQIANKLAYYDQKVHLHVRTEQERIDNFFPLKSNIELHFFNQSDLTARKFSEKYPMLNALDKKAINHETLLVDGEFRLLLLGFGWRGHELLKKCICDAQFKGSDFSATIIDKDFKIKNGEYPLLYNECIEKYHLEFNPGNVDDVDSYSFYQWFEANSNFTFNRIIIALGDDRMNVETAQKISRIFQNTETGIKSNEELRNIIFAYVQNREQFSYYYDENYTPSLKSTITLFGNMEEIYTYDVVVNETMDRIAKMVNYVYSMSEIEQLDTLDDKWDEIEAKWAHESIFNKNSSRAVAMNIRNIYEITDGKWDVLKNTDKLETLAENEHLRWNAFHFVNGIRTWNLEDITTENAKLKDKNGNLLKHGCLIDFEKLPLVAKKVNTIRKRNGNMNEENYRETDRRIVRHFHLFWQEMNR
jgi:hypothetical protein